MQATARITPEHLRAMSTAGERFAGLTAYDASFAAVLDACEVDFVLVGDSLGMVVQGHANTRDVTMADMVYHTRCVARTTRRALVICDMPYQSFEEVDAALANAGALIEAGAQMVKLEACTDQVQVVAALVASGIPVCAHLGLRPQSLESFEGVQRCGKDAIEAQELFDAAQALTDAGTQLLLLECVYPEVASKITQQASVPVIGIGSGSQCDGQVLVLQDVLGLADPIPRHAQNFMNSGASIADAVRAYVQAVRSGDFP